MPTDTENQHTATPGLQEAEHPLCFITGGGRTTARWGRSRQNEPQVCSSYNCQHVKNMLPCQNVFAKTCQEEFSCQQEQHTSQTSIQCWSTRSVRDREWGNENHCTSRNNFTCLLSSKPHSRQLSALFTSHFGGFVLQEEVNQSFFYNVSGENCRHTVSFYSLWGTRDKTTKQLNRNNDILQPCWVLSWNMNRNSYELNLNKVNKFKQFHIFCTLWVKYWFQLYDWNGKIFCLQNIGCCGWSEAWLICLWSHKYSC